MLNRFQPHGRVICVAGGAAPGTRTETSSVERPFGFVRRLELPHVGHRSGFPIIQGCVGELAPAPVEWTNATHNFALGQAAGAHQPADMRQLKVGGEGGSKKNVLAERQHVCVIDR